jgi:hypothetical protein
MIEVFSPDRYPVYQLAKQELEELLISFQLEWDLQAESLRASIAIFLWGGHVYPAF